MSLDYDKIKRKQEGDGSQWTSYSDLFMVLSFVFLLLYVFSSIRNGAFSIQKKIKYTEIQNERDDLKTQMQAYNVLTEKAKKETSEKEMETYNQLMDKLNLLSDEQKNEKERLQNQAKENANKEMALNHYQQMIRNIINTNLMAKKRIVRRDDIIDQKNVVITDQIKVIDLQRKDISEKTEIISDQESIIGQKNAELVEKKQIIQEKEQIIVEKTQQIDELEKDIEDKRQIIFSNNREIESINKTLEEKIANLKKLRSKNKKDSMKYNLKIAQLRSQSEKKIKDLEGKNIEVSEQLNDINGQLEQASNQLSKANVTISEQKREQDKLLQEIKKVEQEYNQQLSQLKSDHVNNITREKEKFDEQMKNLKLSQAERERQANEFAAEMARKEKDLKNKIVGLNSLYENKANELENVQSKLSNVEDVLAKETKTKENLEKTLEGTKSEYQKQLENIRNNHKAKMAAERSAYEKEMKKQRISAAARKKKLEEFRQQADAKQAALEGKLAGLKVQVDSAEREVERSLASIDKLQKEKGVLAGDLDIAKQNVSIKRKLAQAISDNFKKAGIKADVDPRSGEVVLSFGKDYFDAGKANLKSSMKDTLQKFIPTYTASLLGDPKIADKVSSVELIGFASPTYGGKYIDPNKLDKETRNAVSYNMDLSFQRAKSIFDYIFNPKDMNYEYQQKIRPMVKVTGKSFLAEGAKGRDVESGITSQEYCKKFNCQKSQRVIIKFNLKD